MKLWFTIASFMVVPVAALAQPAEPAPAEPAPAEPAPVEPAPAAPAASPVVTGQEPSPLPNDLAVESATPRASAYFADPPHHRLELDLELFGTGAYTDRTGPSISEFRLDRGELGTIVGLGDSLGAELRLESVRSAGEGGALGVQGDSVVIRVKRAQIYGDLPIDPGTGTDVTLHGALGITADLWITALETDYPLRPLSATASERVLGWPTSDLSALARVAYGWVRASVSVGNGEGLDYPERNNGKTTTAVVEAVPLDLRGAARLRFAAVGRDGSVGPARVRERRFGGASTLWTPMVGAGVEVVQAYGLGDRGDLEALALAGWVEIRPVQHLALAGRATTIHYNTSGRATSLGGALALEPWRGATSLRDHDPPCATSQPRHGRCGHAETSGNVRLWLAFDRTTTSGSAMPIPGADPGNATTLLLIASTTAPFTLD